VQLGQYIEKITSVFVQRGMLEGILLAGLLDMRAADLFAQYINRTGDVQTAVLALVHVHPKKFKDTRVDQWVKR
jgi:hypothetical protein